MGIRMAAQTGATMGRRPEAFAIFHSLPKLSGSWTGTKRFSPQSDCKCQKVGGQPFSSLTEGFGPHL